MSEIGGMIIIIGSVESETFELLSDLVAALSRQEAEELAVAEEDAGLIVLEPLEELPEIFVEDSNPAVPKADRRIKKPHINPEAGSQTRQALFQKNSPGIRGIRARKRD